MLVVAGAFFPAGARAQAPDTVRGLQIQRLGEGITPFQRVTLDGPRPKGPSAVIYLDGQRRDSTALMGLNPDDIATMSVVKPDVVRWLGYKEAQGAGLLITTKAGAHTHAVRAFNRRLRKLEQAHPPANNPK
jgi:hypothetical protein